MLGDEGHQHGVFAELVQNKVYHINNLFFKACDAGFFHGRIGGLKQLAGFVADQLVEQPAGLEDVDNGSYGRTETEEGGGHAELRLAECGEGHVEHVDQPTTRELADQRDDLIVRREERKYHHVVQLQLAARSRLLGVLFRLRLL